MLLVKIQCIYSKCDTFILQPIFYSWTQENVYIKSSMQHAQTKWRFQVKISEHEESCKMMSCCPLIIPISVLVYITKLVNDFFTLGIARSGRSGCLSKLEYYYETTVSYFHSKLLYNLKYFLLKLYVAESLFDILWGFNIDL